MIARCADGDDAVASSLLAGASSKTVEELQREAQARNARSRSRSDRLRRSQYVSIKRDDDNLVVGQFRLLPELTAGWLGDWERAEHDALVRNSELPTPLPIDVVCAEAFSAFLSSRGEKQKSTIAFHVDLGAWQRGWPQGDERCEIAGIGPVPVSVVEQAYDDSALRLVVTSKNKLVWYSEEDRRKKREPLPEPIKRAVKAAGYDQCKGNGCVNRSTEVDHIVARSKQGGHELENLQGLCDSCHDAKTMKDSPWTVGRFFRRKSRAGPAGPTGESMTDECCEEPFPDTG